MLDGPPPASVPAGDNCIWTVVRVILGLAQMAGALISVTLLLRTGMTTRSLAAVVLTSLCTTVSVLLFGNRRRAREVGSRVRASPGETGCGREAGRGGEQYPARQTAHWIASSMRIPLHSLR